MNYELKISNVYLNQLYIVNEKFMQLIFKAGHIQINYYYKLKFYASLFKSKMYSTQLKIVNWK